MSGSRKGKAKLSLLDSQHLQLISAMGKILTWNFPRSKQYKQQGQGPLRKPCPSVKQHLAMCYSQFTRSAGRM